MFVKPKKGKYHASKKQTWKLNCCHGNITICVTVCRSQGTLLVPSLSYNASIFPEIFLIL